MPKAQVIGDRGPSYRENVWDNALILRKLMETTKLVAKAKFVDTFRGVRTSLGNDNISS